MVYSILEILLTMQTSSRQPHRRLPTCSSVPDAHKLQGRLAVTVTYRPQNMLPIGTAAPLPLMFVAALLLKTLITSCVMATQRTSARGKNIRTREACSPPVKPSRSVTPVAIKELATSGSVFPAEITPAVGQNQVKSVGLSTSLASVVAASSTLRRSN